MHTAFVLYKSPATEPLFASNSLELVDIMPQICENERHVVARSVDLQQILVLHGPNLNLLGKREPAIYGTTTLDKLNGTLITLALDRGFQLDCKQTNAEYELINSIHNAATCNVKFIIINAAGLAHTSIALRDALLAVQLPFIEVHISNTFNREEFRERSYLSDIAHGVIVGLGTIGYELALNAAIQFLNNE